MCDNIIVIRETEAERGESRITVVRGKALSLLVLVPLRLAVSAAAVPPHTHAETQEHESREKLDVASDA
jgi:hypothetical protein